MPQRELYIVPDYCDSMNDSLPGSSVHRILQARTLERIAHFLLHSDIFQNDSFPPPPTWSLRSFSFISTWEPGQLLKVNHEVLCAPLPPSPSSPEVFNSQSCPHWSSNSSVIVQVFLTWYWFPRESLLVNLFFDKPCLHLPICLSSLGTNGLPCVLSILRYLSCWFFSLFSFQFVVRTEWWFPSF